MSPFTGSSLKVTLALQLKVKGPSLSTLLSTVNDGGKGALSGHDNWALAFKKHKQIDGLLPILLTTLNFQGTSRCYTK